MKGCMRNETFRVTRQPTGAQNGLRPRLGDPFRFARAPQEAMRGEGTLERAEEE